jgi:enamine deaminase RidA (YjgF/YER057c/UK114 family)
MGAMLKSVLTPALLAALAAGCASAVPPATVSCTHRNEAVERSIGFCQAVRAGDVLYISGVTGEAPMQDAVPRVYEQLRRILKANGLTPADVVKETVYATDLDAFIKVRESRRQFYGSWLPSATWVQVQRLYLPSFVVEVELVAHYGK